MSLQQWFEDRAADRGWDENSMLELAVSYIERQCDDTCFMDYIQTIIEEEEEMSIYE